MRTLIEIILAAALIAFGWEQSLKQRIPWLADNQIHSPTTTLNPRPTPTVSGSWMWDPNRRTVLDTPPPHAAPSASANSFLLDPNHRSPLDPPRKSPR
jgi:hypothetical protein